LPNKYQASKNLIPFARRYLRNFYAAPSLQGGILILNLAAGNPNGSTKAELTALAHGPVEHRSQIESIDIL
jgi:hypothetical protein